MDLVLTDPTLSYVLNKILKCPKSHYKNQDDHLISDLMNLLHFKYHE